MFVLQRCFTAAAGVCLALSALSAAGGPRLTFEPPALDFGVVAPWGKTSLPVTIGNDGDEPLRISEVVPSCGCTMFDLGRTELAPGESTPIVVTFQPGGDSGIVRNTLRISGNDPTAPLLRITATVADVYGLKGGVIDLGDGAEKTVPLLRGATIRAGNGHVRVDVTPANGLHIAVSAESDGEETIAIDPDPPAAAVALTVRWRRGDPIVVEPSRILLYGTARAPLAAEVRVRRRSGGEVPIASVSGTDSRLQAHPSGSLLRIRYAGTTGERSDRTLTIETAAGRVEVPVIVMVE